MSDKEYPKAWDVERKGRKIMYPWAKYQRKHAEKLGGLILPAEVHSAIVDELDDAACGCGIGVDEGPPSHSCPK